MNTEAIFDQSVDLLLSKSLRAQHKDFGGTVRGIAGALLCHIQDFVSTAEVKHKNRVDKVIDSLTQQPPGNFSFGYGLSGLAWIINMTRTYDLFENIDDWLLEYNTVVEKYYHLMLLQKDLDYFRGASGILFYFLEGGYLRKKIVELFVDCLYERENGIPPSYYVKRNKSHINLGTPHGLTGVILILLRLKEHRGKLMDSLIVDLLDELLSYKKSNCPYYFPGTVSETDEAESGLAWCYGDLMASYALLKAGILLRKEKYIDLVQPILIELAQREDCSDKLVLCHGYTSTSLIFRKMYDLTNDKMLHNASVKWRKMAIDTFNSRFEMYQKKQLYSDYFENMSLFYGFPGILLSNGKIFYREIQRSLLL